MNRKLSVEERYTLQEINRYEAIYGRHFISPGGLASTRQFLELVTLHPESRVLDVGCGIGGSAFYISRTFGCRVDGIDLSGAMIRVAKERVKQEGLEAMVQFFEGDCVSFQYPRNNYSLIYSRDVFLHIDDKRALFGAMRRNLALDGDLLFTDYIRGQAAQSEECRAYIRKYGYALEEFDSYRELLIESGFNVLRSENLTNMFIDIHKQELAGLCHTSLDREDVVYLEARWKEKILRAERGEQGWALFLARRAE